LSLNRKGLYKSFSKGGNPAFNTVLAVLDNLGYGISVYQKKTAVAC
jgi:DNA-binding phage protein